jgi:hypothetical protein
MTFGTLDTWYWQLKYPDKTQKRMLTLDPVMLTSRCGEASINAYDHYTKCLFPSSGRRDFSLSQLFLRLPAVPPLMNKWPPTADVLRPHSLKCCNAFSITSCSLCLACSENVWHTWKINISSVLQSLWSVHSWLFRGSCLLIPSCVLFHLWGYLK